MFLLLMENHSASQVVGDPYVASLMNRYGAAVDYSGVSSPSLPNYLAITSGQWATDNFGDQFSGQTGDYPDNAPFGVGNLFNQLQQAGISWGAYADGYPANLPSPIDYDTLESNGYGFAGHHFPALFYSDVVNSPAAMSHLGSWAQLEGLLGGPAGGVPDFVWITPTVSNADNVEGMAPYVDAITSSAAWKAGGVLIVTWDNQPESDGTLPGFTQAPDTTAGGGNVLALVISPDVAPGTTYGEQLSHYSTLRAIEQAYGLPLLGDAATAAPWPQLESLLEAPPAAPAPTGIQLAPGPDAVVVGETVTVIGTVTVPPGADPAGWTVDLGTSEGRIAATATTGPSGTFSAAFTAPETPGQVVVSAAVAGADPPVQTTAGLGVDAGPPAIVTAEVEPGSVAPHGPATVTGLVQDTYGNPIAGATVAVAVGGQTLATASTGPAGAYSTSVTAPAQPGAYSLDVSVSGSPSVATATALQVTWGPPAGVTVALTPSPTPAGASLTVRGLVEDAEGDGLANQPVTVVVGSGQPVGASSGTGGAYEISVSAPTPSGSYPVTVEAGGGSVEGRAALTVVAGPAHAVTVRVAPASVAAGGSVTASGAVTDAYGNPVAGQVVQLTVGAGPSTPATTAGDGGFSAQVPVPPAPGRYTLTATVQGASADATASVTVLAGTPASITAAVDPSPVDGGAALTVGGTVADSHGNGVPDQAVAVSVAGAAPVAGTTGASGDYSIRVVAPAAPGSYTVTASAASVEASVPLTVTAGPPATVTESLTPASAPAGASVVVAGTVGDADGNGIAGEVVQVTVAGGAAATATTGPDGAYSLHVTAPARPGTYPVSAKAAGSSAEASANLTVPAPAPAGITETLLPATVAAGGSVTASGVVSGGVSGTRVLVTLGGETPVIAVEGSGGRYTASLTAPSDPGDYRVTASVPGSAAAATHTLTVEAAAPPTVTEALAAASVAAGGTVAVTGTVASAGGAGLPGQVVDVAVGDAPPVSGTTGSSGTYSVTLTAPEAAATYAVTTTVAGTGASASEPLTVAAGPAADVTASVSPAPAAAGAAVAVTGTVSDAHGNPVAGEVVEVTLGAAAVSAVTGGDGTYGASLNAPAAAGPYQVAISVEGSTAGQTVPLVVTTAPAASVTLTLSPASVAAGAAVDAAGTVLDAAGNGVSGQHVTVGVGNGGATVTTGASGAFQAQLTAPSTPGTYAVAALVAGSGASAAQSLTVTAASQPAVSVTVAPSSVAPGGTATVSGSVTTARQPSVGATVQVSVDGASPAATATTDAHGAYSIQVAAPETPGTATVRVAVEGAAASNTATLAVAAAAPTLTSLSPTSGPAGTTLTLQGGGFRDPGAAASRVIFMPAGSGSPLTVSTGPGQTDATATVAIPATLAGRGPVAVSIQNTSTGLTSAALTFDVTAPAPPSVVGSGGGLPGTGGLGGAAVGAAPAPAASGGGGSAGATPAPNVPVHQSPRGVSEAVNTAAGPVTVATSNDAFAFVLPPDSMPKDTPVQVSQVSPSSLPPLPSGTEVASSVWSVNTGGAEPTNPVAATFAYQLPAGVSPQQLGLYTLVGGSWRFYTGGQVNTGTLTATLPHLSTWAVLANDATFPDVPATNWAFRDVEELTAAGIVSGLPDGTFGPAVSVTRGAFLKMLLGALGIPPHIDATQPFADVSAADWDAGYADAAEAVGILQGNGGNAFLGQDITRQEAAVLLMRGLAYVKASAPAGTPPAPSDGSSVASWAAPDVTAALAEGLLHGYPDGSFRPLATLTRAEAAAMAEAVAQLVEAKG